MMKLKPDYKSIIKETSISNGCGSHYCCGGLFLSCTEPCFRKQHIRSWYCAFEFYSPTVVGDYDDFECGLADYRIFHLWERVWGENSIYQCDASTVSGCV